MWLCLAPPLCAPLSPAIPLARLVTHPSHNERMQHATQIKLFTASIKEQQDLLEQLSQAMAKYDQTGVLVQCSRCGADIRPTELDQCRPAPSQLSFLFPACSTSPAQLDQ